MAWHQLGNKPLWWSHEGTHIDGLAQDCSISSAFALEILQSCAKPSKHASQGFKEFHISFWQVGPFTCAPVNMCHGGSSETVRQSLWFYNHLSETVPMICSHLSETAPSYLCMADVCRKLQPINSINAIISGNPGPQWLLIWRQQLTMTWVINAQAC